MVSILKQTLLLWFFNCKKDMFQFLLNLVSFLSLLTSIYVLILSWDFPKLNVCFCSLPSNLKIFYTGEGSLIHILYFLINNTSEIWNESWFGLSLPSYNYFCFASDCFQLMLYFRFRHLMLRSSYMGNGIKRHE